MNTQKVLETLLPWETTAREAAQFYEDQRRGRDQLVVLDLRFILDPIEQTLAQELEFQPEVGMGFAAGNSWTAFNAAQAAGVLFDLAGKVGSVQAVDQLEKAISAHVIDGRWIGVLWHVDVEDEVILGPGLRIVPLSNLSGSETLRDVLAAWSLSAPALFRPMFPPSACLILDTPAVPFFCSSHDRNLGVYDADNRLADIATLLTALSDCTPTLRPVWFEPIDEDLRAFGRGGYHWRFSPTPSFAPASAKIDSGAAKLLTAFDAMSTVDRRAMITALSRLNSAKCAFEQEAKAIDTCICLEALLCSNDENEHRKAFLGRSALLVPKDCDGWTSKETADKLYQLRGKAVHGRASSDQAAAREIARRGISLAEEVARLLIFRNAIPEWKRYSMEAEPISRDASRRTDQPE